MIEPLRHPSLGDPSRTRVVCHVCTQIMYVDEIKSLRPLFAAEYVVKLCCPRKARCQAWVDRGCRIETIEGEPGAEEDREARNAQEQPQDE